MNKKDKQRYEIVRDLCDEIGATKVAEIGVKRGDTAAYILNYCPKIEFYLCVDPMLSHSFYRESVSRNTAFFKMTSEKAAPLIQDSSLDLVFIDGLHDFRNVMLDIKLWLPKVRSGGILCGHDYGQKNVTRNPKDVIEVKEAVDKFFWPEKIDLVQDIVGVLSKRPEDKNRAVWIYRVK